MKAYFYKTPRLAEWLYPSLTWKIRTRERALYLSFDDGPQPGVTDWVLDQLHHYNAKATFFCVGNNVQKYPELYQRLLDEGHATGNHTQDHLNGWKSDKDKYLKNVDTAANYIRSKLFRPPYGKMKPAQRLAIARRYKIVMWGMLAGDFDPHLNIKNSLDKIIQKAEPGYIIVLHDSLKAEANLRFILPAILHHFNKEGYIFKAIPQ